MNKPTHETSGTQPAVRSHARPNAQKGFLELIVVIIIALVLLNVLGIDIKEFLAKPWVREFGEYVVSLLKIVWQDILEIVAFIKDLLA